MAIWPEKRTLLYDTRIIQTDTLKLSQNRWYWSGFRSMGQSTSFSFSSQAGQCNLFWDSLARSIIYFGTVQWLQMFRAVNVNGETLGGAWLATKTVIAINFANILRFLFQEKLKAVTGDWFKDVQKELPPSPRRIIEEKIKILEPTQRELNINDPEPNMKPSQTLTPSEPRPRMSVQHSNSHSSHQSQGSKGGANRNFYWNCMAPLWMKSGQSRVDRSISKWTVRRPESGRAL